MKQKRISKTMQSSLLNIRDKLFRLSDGSIQKLSGVTEYKGSWWKMDGGSYSIMKRTMIYRVAEIEKGFLKLKVNCSAQWRTDSS